MQRPIPVWIGGQSPRAYRRIGRLADGWFPQVAPGPDLTEALALVAEGAAEAGRGPADLGMPGRVTWRGDADQLVERVQRWRNAGASHVAINTMRAGLGTVDDHQAALEAAAAALELS